MNRAALLFVCGCLSAPFVAFVAAATSAPTAPAAPGVDFTIPPQPLSTALITFGKQANLQVLTAGGTIASFRSDGVSGSFSPDAALIRLLQGTGLSYVFINGGTVVVKPREPASNSPPHATATSTAANIANAKLLAPVHAEGMDEKDSGYMVDTTSSATRTDSDLIDVPQSVSVITRDLMDSQQIRTVADAVRNVAGVQYIDGTDSLPNFQIRGFNPGNGMTDGMPNSIAATGDFPPLIGVERVEVMKGPEAILGDSIGNNDFGGLINVIMKKPQSDPVHEFSYSIGEYGDTQAGIDLAGPLGNSGELTYRLVLSDEYADHTAQGYQGQRSSYFASSIGWHDKTTKLVVGVERILNRLPIPDHTILLNDSVSSASPAGILLGNPSDHATYQTSRFYYMLEQQLGDVWTFRSRGQYVRQSTDQQDWTLSNPTPTGDVDAAAEVYRYADAYYTLQSDITATFGEGLLTHTVVVGFDYSRSLIEKSDDIFNNIDGVPYNIFTGAPLPPVRSVVVSANDVYLPGSPWSTTSGLFLQDQIAVGEYWDVLLAWRHSAYELSTYDANGSPWNLHKTQGVPSAGVVYKITPDIALYGSTANGFQPDYLLGKNGHPLAPIMSRQIEAGSKLDLFQDRARLTVSWYRIMVDSSYDLLSAQPPYFFSQGPGQTNNGVEVEFTGRIAPGLDITTSYTNAHIVNHDGTPSTGTPRQHYNLWASYWFQGSALRGWGIAGGVLARSRSLGQTTDDNTYFDIPGQASVDANVSYRTKNWSMAIGVKNLFGRNLLSDNFDETFVPLHNRRSFLLSGAYDF
ncbi:TonB-dependent receptor [Rhodanobacter sp. C01]|uniref:TonB-dependent siderophore receptor n=1 Tax=Rhodanobacter sp. C01 TaxID=1945856 RepID=UPI000987B7F5|nr:TonB-dependent receptor [Rhodanobacter sp. C01]OOG49471.1 TonB-dependent siderophore receptor [Rhodanobacter sp. C01]